MENVLYLEVDDFHSNGKLRPYVNEGKCTLLMAQGDFCGFCTKAKPAFQQLATNSKDIVCATIRIDGDKTEREAAKFLKVWYSGYQGVPTYFGFDKHGNFKKVHEGGRDVESLRKFAESL